MSWNSDSLVRYYGMQQDLPLSCTPDFPTSEAGNVAYTKPGELTASAERTVHPLRKDDACLPCKSYDPLRSTIL